MTRPLMALLLAFVGLGVTVQPAFADGCGGHLGLASQSQVCRYSGDEVRSLYATAADDGYTYTLESRCKPGDNITNCQVYASCRNVDGEEGTIYIIYRTVDATGDRARFGEACLTPGESNSLGTITPAMVRREMQRLEWPRAELTIQPPDGQTLINFDTNFFTDNTGPTTQSVTLLGQDVTIEATPTDYTWHFGDDAAMTTSSPGAPYPDLDVTHDYEATGQVAPSVDTTYTGRYRINGGGWQQIPGSLTVEGATVNLQVRSATPHLVGSN